MLFSKCIYSFLSLTLSVSLISSLYVAEVHADQCEEQKLIAEIQYNKMYEDFFHDLKHGISFYDLRPYTFGNSEFLRSNAQAVEDILKSVSDAKSLFNSQLSEDEKKLLQLNSTSALNQETILEKLNNSFRKFVMGKRIDELRVYDNNRAILCHRYNRVVRSDGINSFCIVFGLPDFSIMTTAKNKHELYKRIVVPTQANLKRMPKSELGGIFNLDESKEAFIQRVNTTACKNATNQMSRQTVKENEIEQNVTISSAVTVSR